MAQHYTKTTVEASIWCTRCNRETPWRIADGRQQYCTVCYDKGTAAAEAKKANMNGAQHCKCFPGKASCAVCRGTGWVALCDRCDGAGMKDNTICMRCAGHGKMLMPRPVSVVAGAHDAHKP